MEFIFNKSNLLDDYINELQKISNKYKIIVTFIASGNNYNNKRLNSFLKKIKSKIFGGVFCEIIYKNKSYNQGFEIFACNNEIDFTIIKKLSKITKNEISQKIENFYDRVENKNYKNMFIVSEGYNKNINNLLLGIFENFGSSVNYTGLISGDGIKKNKKKSTILINNKLYSNSGLLMVIKEKADLEVISNFKNISEELKITSSKKNTIKELNYKNASKVYKDIIQKHYGRILTNKEFKNVTLNYPVGICRLSGELIARAVLKCKKKKLVLPQKIPKNTFIKIMAFEKNNSINDVKKKVKLLASKPNESIGIVAYCLGRKIILGDKFKRELEEISKINNMVMGVISFGEVANKKINYLNLYNLTITMTKVRAGKDAI